MIFAVIPAAGKSARMGRPKLLLPLHGRPVLEHTVAAFHEAGVPEVLVVMAPGHPALARVAEKTGAYVLILATETADMRTTVERGLDWFEQQCHPDPGDNWFLAPADHPAVEPMVIRCIMDEKARNPQRSIAVPTFQGKRGHPVLLAWKHVEGIREWPAGLGLNSYLRARPDDTVECPVASSAILLDMDTPDDYEKLRGNGDATHRD